MNLVEVYATVTDRRGEPVAGLSAADFRVIEDGAAQAITTFAAGEFPLSVGGRRRSQLQHGRQDNRLGVAKSAARALVGALRPGDRGDGGGDRRRDRDRRAARRPIARPRSPPSIGSTRGAPRRSTTRRLRRARRDQPARGTPRARAPLGWHGSIQRRRQAADLVDRATATTTCWSIRSRWDAGRPPIFAELRGRHGRPVVLRTRPGRTQRRPWRRLRGSCDFSICSDTCPATAEADSGPVVAARSTSSVIERTRTLRVRAREGYGCASTVPGHRSRGRSTSRERLAIARPTLERLQQPPFQRMRSSAGRRRDRPSPRGSPRSPAARASTGR